MISDIGWHGGKRDFLVTDTQTISPRGKMARIIAESPPHIRAGLEAYRAALSCRQDWHAAVTAAIEEAMKVIEKNGEGD